MKVLRRAFKSTSFTNNNAGKDSVVDDNDIKKSVQFKNDSIKSVSPSLVTSTSNSKLPLSPSTSSTNTTGTWSAMVQLDLVENLSQRERTRQEVLWEIVASEERYVQDLLQLYQSYIKPLLSSSIHIYIPNNFKLVLNVLGDQILNNHVSLSNDLIYRHKSQYPLVRSLADIFLSHSHNLEHYSVYVLNLEYCLHLIDKSISIFQSNHYLSKRNENFHLWNLGKHLVNLENICQSKSEAGLAISLLKPFQRLLKYPLLFRNLLFNSDPSMIEYESTINMVEKVEKIVKSIEDKKIQSEERDKIRDIFARIEGIEKERNLMAPKPGRLLISELQVQPKSLIQPKQLNKKTSFRRLSDLLPTSANTYNNYNNSNGEIDYKLHYNKRDLWFVEFNDVTLLCQKVGKTNLPIASNNEGNNLKRSSLSSNKSSNSNLNLHSRNLYRFLKIEKWNISDHSNQGIISMNAILRSRSNSSNLLNDQNDQNEKNNNVKFMKKNDNDKGNEEEEIKSKSSTKLSYSYSKGDEMIPFKFKNNMNGNDQSIKKFGNRLRPSLNNGSINGIDYRPSSRATTTGTTYVLKKDYDETLTKRTLTPQPPPTSNSINKYNNHKLNRRGRIFNENNVINSNINNDQNDLSNKISKDKDKDKDKDLKRSDSISSMETSTNVRKTRKSRAPSEDSGLLLVKVADQYLRETAT